MCGIIGIAGNVREGDWHDTHSLLTELLVQSMERGTDATGFAAVTSPLDAQYRHRLITGKDALAAEAFCATNPFWGTLRRMRCCSVIAHVRYATSGSPQVNANNHPFIGKATHYAFSVVHNGIIQRPEDAADRLKVKLTTDCDSEIIEKMISVTGNIPLGIRRCLSELRGSMAIAAVEHRTGTVWLARDYQRPLWVARLRDRRRMVFASTPQIIQRAVEKRLGKFGDWVIELHPLTPGYVYALTPDARLFSVFTSAASRLEEVVETG
jgi:glucosamine 6-phosphate synthetase-like amidotransferase/phosphosugar isomerase protein